MGLLYKTKAYLIGAIENETSKYNWRNHLKEITKDLNIVYFDPTDKPFLHKQNEDEDFKKNLKSLRELDKFDELSQCIRKIRGEDLSLVDRADWNIFYLDLEVQTTGSWEEWFTSVKLLRPSYLIIKQGINKAPIWCFGCIHYSYMFNSIEEFSNHLYKIDSGEIEIDTKRWKLLDYKYR